MQKKSPYNVKKIATLYGEELKKYGYNLASIMIPKGASDARFKVKFDIGNLNNTRVLDVGCGRLGYIAFLPEGYYFSDFRNYEQAAISLLEGNGFGAEYQRPPMYPVFIAAHYALFG